MSENFDWQSKYKEADAYHVKRMEKLAKQNGIHGEFHLAALEAYRVCEESGILPLRDEFGEFKYQPAQGIKAACHAREDASATLLLQIPILARLQFIQRTTLFCAAVLVYIAFRIS